MGQLVGPRIQLRVGQLLLAGLDRHRLRCARHLRFEQTVQGLVEVVGHFRGVEVGQQLLALLGRQHGQAIDRQLRRLLQRLDQPLQRHLQISAYALRPYRRRGHGGEAETIALIVHIQRQRVVGALLAGQGMDALPGLRQRRVLAVAVTVVEHRAEQRLRRGDTAATLGQRQGRMFVTEQRGQPCMGLLDRHAHAAAVDIHAQWQGVDEHAQGTVTAFTALHAPQQHGAKHHALLPGGAGQDARPGQVEQARGADAQQACLGAQALIEGRSQIQLDLFDGVAVAAHILQAKRQGRLIDVAEHPTEELFMRLFADAQPCLRHVIAVRRGVSRGLWPPEQTGLHLVTDTVERGVVKGDMVEQQDRDHALVGRVRRVHQAYQRCLVHGYAVVAWVETLVQVVEDISLHHQLSLAPHHLQRLGQALPDHRGAQDIVAIDHLLQGLGEGIQAFEAVERQVRLEQVGIALPCADMVVENAFLQRRQRVDVLHIGRATGHLGDDVINRRLIEFHQRQQVWRNALAVGGNAVGRHLHIVATANGGGQCGQGRLAEQHAHIGPEADLAHAFDQADGQQRMATQLEEVVMAPHLLDVQHLGPDPGQGRFNLAQRGFVFTRQPCRLVGLRQGIAIQLAVGRQRQCVHLHIGDRHQGLGQSGLQLRAQGIDVQRLLFGEPGDQAAFAHQHHGFADAVQGSQAIFDFPQFDPHATHFHLVVVTAQVLEVAIGQPARQVAGAVHTPGVEGVLQEAFGAQVRSVQVTPRHTAAADIQLARHPHRHRPQVRVQQVHAGIRDRPADVQQLPGAHAARRGNHRGFGGAIVVDHRKAPLLGELAQAVTANQQDAQRGVLQALAEGVFGHRCRQEADVQRLCQPPRQQLINVFIADVGGWQVHGGAHAQGRPHLPGHRVEPDTGDAAGMARGIQAKSLAVPVHQVFHGAVFHHHALGLAGGARGVDYVGQVRRGQGLEPWVADRVLLQARVMQVHAGDSAQQLPGTGFGQHRHGCAVVQQVGDTLGGISGVDGHVTGAGLEDAQQAHQHLRAATAADSDPIIRLYALLQQTMGQLVGAHVELLVRQRFTVLPHGNGVRLALGLHLEGAVDGAALGEIGAGGVERAQQGIKLRRRQNPPLIEGGVRRAFQGGDQLLNGVVHIAAQALGANLRQRQHRQGEAFTQIIHAQGQRVVTALFTAEQLHAFPDAIAIAGHFARVAVPVVEQCTEQRRCACHATAALGQCQGRVFVAEQGTQAPVGCLHRSCSRRRHVDPQRQGIDEHAQRAVRTVTGLQAAHQYGAEHHVVTPGHQPQHLCPGQVHQARRTDTQVPCLLAHPLGQRCVHRLFGLFDVAPIALHVLYPERQGRLIHVGEHVAEEGLVFLHADTQARLGDVVAKRGCLGQVLRAFEHERAHLLAHHFHGGVVQPKVVEQQDRRDPIVRRVMGIHHAQQGRLGDIQAVVASIKTRMQLVDDAAIRRVQDDFLNPQLRFAPHHLHRAVQAFPDYPGTQDVVARDYLLQRAHESLQTCQAVECQA